MRRNLGGACGLRKIARTPAQDRHLGAGPASRNKAETSEQGRRLDPENGIERLAEIPAYTGTEPVSKSLPPKTNRELFYWSGDPEPPRSPAGVPVSRRTPCRFQTRARWRTVRIATIVRTPLQHTAGVFLCAIVSPPQQLRALPIGCRSRCFLHHNLPAATTRSQVPGSVRTTAVFARPPPQRIFAAPGHRPTRTQ